jgi:uncharacterized protein (DUF1786 family)
MSATLIPEIRAHFGGREWTFRKTMEVELARARERRRLGGDISRDEEAMVSIWALIAPEERPATVDALAVMLTDTDVPAISEALTALSEGLEGNQVAA